LPFVKHMPPFACPNGALSEGNLERLRLAEERIGKWTERCASSTIDWLESPVPGLPQIWVRRLSHPLSGIIEQMNRGRSRRGASLSELEICRALEPLRSNCPLEFELMRIASSLGLSSPEFRNHPVRTRGDNFGNIVAYRPPSCIASEIEALGLYLLEHVAEAPLLSAIAVYCGVTAIHPFADGNGRAARILFNLILRRALNPHFFLPVFEVAGLSRGGLIIRQRQAHYYGQWEPIADYFCDSVSAVLAAGASVLKPVIAGTMK